MVYVGPGAIFQKVGGHMPAHRITLDQEDIIPLFVQGNRGLKI